LRPPARNGSPEPARSMFEFVALMACAISLPALSTDIMIPGMGAMVADLRVTPGNEAQWIVTAIFFGLVPGQILFGPLADSIGRRPAMLTGIAVFLVGTVLTVAAPSFPYLLLGRAVQGLGVAAPRTLTLAIIRDGYSGSTMARIVSNVMAVFSCIPMIAPVLGQLILLRYSWRWIFASVLIFALIVWVWFYLRQKETLQESARAPLSPQKLLEAFLAVSGNRVVLWYAVGTGCVFAGFITYMSTAPQIFQGIYDTGNAFGFLFALIGLSMVVASYINGRWVERLGMQRICVAALLTVLVASALFAGWTLWSSHKPSLVVVMLYLVLIMFVEGALFSNLYALAMEPLDKSAGMGATLVSSVSMLVSVPLGMLFAHYLTTSILPLIVAFAILAGITLLIIYIVEAGRVTPVTTQAESAP
jgi:DHA1 family bicyclomycin/chloramphenicol resistance-like MFS transporter